MLNTARAPLLAITTPELVTFHYETAGLASRALGNLTDMAIVFVLKIVALVALSQIWALGLALTLVSWLLLDLGYFTYYEWKWSGQTPGKRMFNIHVATMSGAKLRLEDLLLRNLLRPIDMLPLVMAVGGVAAFLDPYRRRLGDLAAGTVVVRKGRRELPAAVAGGSDRENVFWSDGAIRGRILARVTKEERDLLMELMLRRDQIDPLPRQDLFRRAADYFRKRYGLPLDVEHLSDEQVVLNIALVIRDPKALAASTSRRDRR